MSSSIQFCSELLLFIFYITDTTKFGQKLMKKFGWSEGKGLGVKEDGISDHIKVDYKFGNKGNSGDLCDIISIALFCCSCYVESIY